jgi:catechol 2,3-dioxygenase
MNNAVSTREDALMATLPARSSVLPTGIERAGYVAHRSPDPGRAAAFAVEHMGFTLVHIDEEERHYLAAAGLDAYSLVYLEGAEAGIDHVSYVVPDLAALDREEERLAALTGSLRRIDDNPLWRAGRALGVSSPSGHEVRITPGVHVDVPMAALVVPGAPAPAPIAHDHVAIATEDVESEMAFAFGVLGLKESARVVAPEVGTVLAFLRSRTLFHCYTVVRAAREGLHHYQYTLKNGPAVFAAHEEMLRKGEVDLVWGPLRHGPGHSISFYFRDADGTLVEYAAEEEVVFDDEAYAARIWSAQDQNFADEWGSTPPQVFFE